MWVSGYYVASLGLTIVNPFVYTPHSMVTNSANLKYVKSNYSSKEIGLPSRMLKSAGKRTFSTGFRFTNEISVIA